MTRADVPFIVMALLSGALLLYLGRSLTFWFDEWRSITFDGGFVDYFRPVNEHWSTFPLALYRATFEVVELRSYLPYLAQVIVLHLAAVSGAYVLMRRRVGPLVATLLATPLLVLGAGAENLFWAFQTGFVGSVAFGIWALVLVEPPGRCAGLLASGLLIVSLMASGIGLFFVAAVAGRTAFDHALRPRVLVVVAPVIAYLAWHAFLGRDAVGAAADLADPISVMRFMLRGMGYSVEAVVGLDRLPTNGVVGLALIALLCAVALRRTLRGQTSGLAIGCLLGVASMYAVIGIARAELDFDYTTRGRYVYVAAFLLILCIADLIDVGHALTLLPSTSRAAAGIGLVGVLLAWVIAVNSIALGTVQTQFQYQADLTRAIIELAIEHEGEPWLDRDAGLDLMPPAGELPAFVERYGSPLTDAYFPTVVPAPQPQAYHDARRLLTR